MSFPNPDNYARDCDCGTAGANTTPPPATIQGEIDSLDTRVTALEETNDVIVSSGGIAALTTEQQALIREGSIVVTTDGKRWVYSGAGSKVLEASYIELSDLTIGSTANLPLITGASGVITAGSFGSSANTFCQGNDSRLSDARTPLSHTHGNISNGGLIGTTANLPIITGTGGLLQAGSFGTATNTFCQGNDVRVDHVRPLGTNNIFVSNTALSSASLTGAANTAVGVSALSSNTTGGNNIAIGANALSSNTNGNDNIAVGKDALKNANGPDANIGIGSKAGETIGPGGSNIIIGHEANVDDSGRQRCIVLGRSAVSPALDGSLVIGAVSPNAMGNLVSLTSGGTSANKDLIIYLNGTRYLIALKI